MAFNKNPRMVPVKAKPKPKPTKPTNAQIVKAAIKKAQVSKPKPSPKPMASPKPTAKYTPKKVTKPMVKAPAKRQGGQRPMPSQAELRKAYLESATGKRGGNSFGDFVLMERRARGYKNQMDYK